MRKPLVWLGSSQKDVRDLPKDVKKEIGFALYAAELGHTPINSVPMVGFGGAKVVEIIVTDDGETYRAVYTVKFKLALYVLHVFQKKSKTGDKTPRQDMALINGRLKMAEAHYEAHYKKVGRHEQGAKGRGN